LLPTCSLSPSRPLTLSEKMPYRINENCTACDLCVDVCPISAISEGDPIYVIDDTCCDFEECLVMCPEEAIVLIEDEEEAPCSS